MRLDKFLADMGVGTRSELKKAIRKSQVTVNGTVAKDPGLQVSSEDQVTFDGTEIRYAEMQYYMLHKPAGVLSASEDRRQTTVVDLIRTGTSRETAQHPSQSLAIGVDTACAKTRRSMPRSQEKTVDAQADPTPAAERGDSGFDAAPVRTDLFPVGRLDKDTEGLLIITNDGVLAHQLLAPKHHIDKTYYAVVTGTITEEDQRTFTRGIRYDEHLTAMPATLRILASGETAGDVRQKLGFPARLTSEGLEEANAGACQPMTALDASDAEGKVQTPVDTALPAETQAAAASVTRILDPTERLRRTRLSGSAFLGAEEAADITEDTLVSEVEITIQEGKFHQIKKMVKALPGGKEILYLRRISMGALTLDPALAPGAFRTLSEEEISILKDATT